MRQLLAVLVTASTLDAQELPPKEVEALLVAPIREPGRRGMQANFREERRLALDG